VKEPGSIKACQALLAVLKGFDHPSGTATADPPRGCFCFLFKKGSNPSHHGKTAAKASCWPLSLTVCALSCAANTCDRPGTSAGTGGSGAVGC